MKTTLRRAPVQAWSVGVLVLLLWWLHPAARAAAAVAAPEPAAAGSTVEPSHSPLAPEKSAHEQWMETVGISMGFVAVVLGIGIAFFALWIDYRKRHELLTICHQERMAALDKGLELPPFPASLVHDVEELALLQRGKEPAQPGSGLKPGLVLVGVGVGIGFVTSWKFSAVLMGLGAALLAYYVIAGRKNEAHDRTPPRP